MTTRFATVLIMLLLGACSVGPDWQSTHHRDHPLTGTIWNLETGSSVTEAEMIGQIGNADFILLGETHDNPDHHVLQARMIRALVSAGRRPAIALEMLSANQQARLDSHLAAAPEDATGIGNAVGWQDTGWPDWTIYQPIAEAALQNELRILAANADRADIRRIAMGDTAALSPDLAARLALEEPIPAPIADSLAAEIDAAHCGYAPDSMIESMVRAQWARDAHMANVIAAVETTDTGIVLIAGTGHARLDRGVPHHLARTQPERRAAAVAFLEVAPGKLTPDDYAAVFGTARLPFDFIWFTPRIDDRDPCERFRESLESMTKHGKKEPPAAN